MAIVVTALLLMVVAIPSLGGRENGTAGSDASRARAALDVLRRAIGQYRYDHGVWPASVCGDAEDADACFVRQLTRASNAAGESTENPAQPHFGPYLPHDVPANPLNGLSTIHVFVGEHGWPSAADGTTGWIYRSSTGELRINAPGEVDGVRFSDL